MRASGLSFMRVRCNAILKFAAHTADTGSISWKTGECHVRGQWLIFTLLGTLALPAVAPAAAATAAAATTSPITSPITSEEQCTQVEAKGAAAWFDQWNLALASLDPDRVARHYWQDAVLLPTLSNTARNTPATVREYFAHFLEKHPRGRIDTHTLHLSCNLVIDMGTYTFALMDGAGRTSELTARYTFVYAYRGGAWKILHHHSSAMPETADAGIGNDRSKAPKGSGSRGVLSGGASKVSVIGGSQPFLNADNSPNVAQFYPVDARERGEQGAVSMQVCTGPGGEVNKSPEIIESSGSEQLDAAAKAWANAADWIPATHQNAAVEGCTRVRVEFRLG
jgi:uncharacterized protein (TIGR02246 family)